MIILRLCVLRLPLVRAADWSLMSVVPQPWPLPVPQVAEAVAAMYGGKRERPLPVLVRDKLGEWLSDEQFAGAYGVRGKPGWPPARLALSQFSSWRRT